MSAPLEVAPGIDALVIDGEVLVFDGTMIHLMSGSGAEIWSAVDGRRTRDGIVDEVARRHGSEPGVADDVRDYLDGLLARGLVMESARTRDRGYLVPDHVAWVADGARVVVLDLRTGDRQTLSATAGRVWVHLTDGLSREGMLARLAEDFPDAPASFVGDTEALVDTLCERGLLTPTG